MSFDPIHLLRYPNLERPDFMLDDPLLPEMDWRDLERTWLKMASPANRYLVQDLVTAIWIESGKLPETHTFHRILATTVILAGPAFMDGSEEGPRTPT